MSHSRDEPTDEPLPGKPTAPPTENVEGGLQSDTGDTTPESGVSPRSSPDSTSAGPQSPDGETGPAVETLNIGTVKSRPVLFVLLTCGFLVCLLCVLGTFAAIALLFLNQ